MTRNISFVLDGMTYLRYYIPLVSALNNRGVGATFYVANSNKYNCPSRHTGLIKSLSRDFNISLKEINDLTICSNPIITVEGAGSSYYSKDSKIYSLNFCTDFIALYKKYIDKIDYLVLPSDFFAQKISADYSHKVLKIGTPKFDTKISRETVLRKYGLDNAKYVTLFYPRNRDLSQFPIDEIIQYLNNLGYFVLIKSREKDPIRISAGPMRRSFYDTDWYPHTSMELIEISDFVINTSSMAVEEAICMGKCTINFDIKPFDQTLPEMFSNKMCINRKNFNPSHFHSDVEEIIKKSMDVSDIAFEQSKFFNNVGNTSNFILDIIL
jgi:hypothetical protein